MSYTESADLTGQTIADGRFQVHELIANGFFTDVYRATDAVLARDVAIKVLQMRLQSDLDLVARFRREVNAMAKLNHPHIVPVLSTGQHDHLPFAVFPLLTGGSLRERIKLAQHSLTEPPITAEKLIWLTQIAEALDYLHSQKLVHCNVTPNSIYFDAENSAYLGGFPRILRVEGNAEYLTPEIILGCDPISGKLDQYSLAVTLYECLAGRLPFNGPTLSVLIAQKQSAPPSLREIHPAHLSRPFVDAVYRALAKSPELRFPSCTAFAQAVISALATPTAPGSIRVTCPRCNFQVMFSPDAVGKNVICPSCQGRWRLAMPTAPRPTRAESRPARMEQAPVSMSRPSVPYTAPGKARRSRTRAPAKPETRRATVRYYRRMNPMRLFPFLVIFSKEMIQQITKRGTDQRDSGPFQVDTEAPVDVEPVLPGCTCHPPKITTKLKSDTDSLVFYVVPNVVGKIQGGKVVVTQNHATLAEVPLKMKVVQRTWFYISAALTVILPFLSALSKHFGWDFETQMDTGFDLYLKVARVVFDLVSPYVLAGILALVTLAAYWMTRPKRKDEFWDIKLVK